MLAQRRLFGDGCQQARRGTAGHLLVHADDAQARSVLEPEPVLAMHPITDQLDALLATGIVGRTDGGAGGVRDDELLHSAIRQQDASASRTLVVSPPDLVDLRAKERGSDDTGTSCRRAQERFFHDIGELLVEDAQGAGRAPRPPKGGSKAGLFARITNQRLRDLRQDLERLTRILEKCGERLDLGQERRIQDSHRGAERSIGDDDREPGLARWVLIEHRTQYVREQARRCRDSLGGRRMVQPQFEKVFWIGHGVGG